MRKILMINILLVLLSCGKLAAHITLPSVFSSNMVLQQKAYVTFWGKAEAGKMVTISCSWTKGSQMVRANHDGNFKTQVKTPAYGGPYQIMISDGTPLKLENVMIGDVWVCSGQSNMEMPLAGWGKVQNYEQEVAAANYPNIRLLQVEKQVSPVPLDNAKVGNGWATCTPATVAEFSSTAYFFAREINKRTGIPIGLIHTSWGGTVAEAWMSGVALKSHPYFGDQVKAFEVMAGSSTQISEAEKVANWQRSILTNDAGYGSGKFPWLARSFDDSKWKNMPLPGIWENSVLPNFDGVVYLRKEVTIPSAWAGKPVKLNLGAIDDNDIAYFDGEKVGETNGYNVQRSYTIPAKMVTAGTHKIAIRVFDSGGGGGVYADDIPLSLSNGENNNIPLAGDWTYAIGLNLKDVGPSPALSQNPNQPTLLYNAMIHPLIQFTIKGAIWYQGESNVERANQYRTLFPALIQDWRKQWNIGDFPFYFVQLANYLEPKEQPVASQWAELRDAQRGALRLPKTGMAVAIDIGDAKDIHPKNKQEVGRRLALIALAKDYGQKIAFSAPNYVSSQLNGKSITITFDGAAKLIAKDGVLKGFAVAGADQQFHWADAVIIGNNVVVKSKTVAKPVAVRYNWANNPNGNLYGDNGLPVGPFKTDDWNDTTKLK